MNTIVAGISECHVLGQYVVYRDESHKALREMLKLAEFSSYPAAVMAIRILRSKDWLRAAELTLDDEDFLTLQVLAKRLSRNRVANQKFSTPTQLFSGSETGIARAEAFSGSLEDLI